MTPSAQTAGGRRVTRWTREAIIEKIAEWHGRYGEPPCSADWNPSLARWRAQEWRVERYRDGVWPSTNAAKRPFGGSFDAAVRAAGFEPARPGPRGRGAARPVGDGALARVEARAADAEAEITRLTRRLAAAERRGERAERRAERAEGKLADARRRARRAAEQAVRARRSRVRDRDVEAETRERAVEEAARAIEEADARVRAAADQAGAALRDAAADRARARELEAEAACARAAAPARRGQLRPGEVARLRDGGPSGPVVLAGALRSLARARATGDRAGLTRALGEVASAAVRWRDRL